MNFLKMTDFFLILVKPVLFSSCLSASLFSCLVFHLLSSLCILVLSRLLLSCLVLSLSPSLLLSFSLSLSVSVSVWCCVLWCCVCACVRVCVYCGTLKKRQKKPCVCTKNHPCVHARGAGTHGDVLNLHTEGVFLHIHTGRQGVIVSSAYQNLPTYGYHVIQRFTKETSRSSPFSV